MTYRHLVLSSGGQKGFLMLGCLQWFFDYHKLNIEKLEDGVGCSIGSLILFLLILGWTPYEIYIQALDESWIDWHGLAWEQAWQCIRHRHGLLDIQTLFKSLKQKLVTKHGKWDFNFRECPQLKVLAVDASMNVEVLYSVDTTPDMVCLDAIGKSCNIPGIFTVNLDDQRHVIVDGAFMNPFPWNYVDTNESLGIAIITNVPKIFMNISEYCIQCINLPLYQLTRSSVEEAKIHNMEVVELMCYHDVSLIHDLTPDEKWVLFKEGYQWAVMHNNSLLVNGSISY